MMSTDRLKGIYKQEQNHRKFMCVMNDLAKTQQDLYDGYLKKEKKEAEQRCQNSIVMTRRNIVRQRVLKKCMTSTRDAAERSVVDEKYGRYKGVCVEQIADNIDTYLEQDHPRIRRQRKLNQLFEKGYDNGEILDSDTAKKKVRDYFEKPLVQIHAFRDSSQTSHREERATYLPPLATGFYSGDVTDDWARLEPSLKKRDKEYDSGLRLSQRKVSKFTDDVPDNLSVQSEIPEASPSLNSTTKLRPITLPPIKVGMDNWVDDGPKINSNSMVGGIPRKYSNSTVGDRPRINSNSTIDGKPRIHSNSTVANQHNINPNLTVGGKPRTNCVADLISRLNRAKDKRERDSKLRKEKRAKRLQAERVHGIPYMSTETATEEVMGHSFIVEGHGQGHLSEDVNKDAFSQKDEKKLAPLKFKSSASVIQKY